MLLTRDGYLWLGTKGGVSRFDGVRFTTFDDRDKTQLRESEVWALAEASDGSLWIGTYGGGLSRLKDGKFTVYTTADGLVSNYVSSILADENDGSVWIGTEAGLSRFQHGRFVTYTSKDDPAPAVRVLHRDTDGSLWIGTIRGSTTDGPTAACRCSGLKRACAARRSVVDGARSRECDVAGHARRVVQDQDGQIDAIFHCRGWPGVEPRCRNRSYSMPMVSVDRHHERLATYDEGHLHVAYFGRRRRLVVRRQHGDRRS